MSSIVGSINGNNNAVLTTALTTYLGRFDTLEEIQALQGGEGFQADLIRVGQTNQRWFFDVDDDSWRPFSDDDFKGYYRTLQELQLAHPNPLPTWVAANEFKFNQLYVVLFGQWIEEPNTVSQQYVDYMIQTNRVPASPLPAYLNNNLMLADQARQLKGNIYIADSTSYIYNGSPTASIDDYIIIASSAAKLTTFAQLEGLLSSEVTIYLEGNIIAATSSGITVPAQGLTLEGDGTRTTLLMITGDNQIMFKSPAGGSGDLTLKNMTIILPGANSHLGSLTNVNNNGEIHTENVNFVNCNELFRMTNYRQLFMPLTGFYSCKNGFTLNGAMNGVFMAQSNLIGFPANAKLFKAGQNLLLRNRMYIALNAKVSDGAVLVDFTPANLNSNELLQLTDCIVTVTKQIPDGNGGFTAVDNIESSNSDVLVPNIAANNAKCRWTGNTGLTNSATALVEENLAVTGNYVIDWLKDTFFLTMTGNTVFTEKNLPASGKNTQEIKLYLSGSFVPTFPAAWLSNLIGSYRADETNEITIKYLKAGVYFVKISNSFNIFPQATFSSLIPSGALPNITRTFDILGEFFTPKTLVTVANQTVVGTKFIDSKTIRITITTSALEGSYSITINNGSPVVYNNVLTINNGIVYVPETATFSVGAGVIVSYGAVIGDTAGTATWNKAQPFNKAFTFNFLIVNNPLTARIDAQVNTFIRFLRASNNTEIFALRFTARNGNGVEITSTPPGMPFNSFSSSFFNSVRKIAIRQLLNGTLQMINADNNSVIKSVNYNFTEDFKIQFSVNAYNFESINFIEQ